MPRGSDGATSLRIETAVTADSAELARLAAEALPEPWSERSFAEEIASPSARVWVARGAGPEAIGYLAAQVVGDELEVLSLAVAAGRRRQGVGCRLLEHALACEPGAMLARLEVRSDDPGAQAFYARLGFRPVARRPRFYRGGVDALSMSRSLRPEVR